MMYQDLPRPTIFAHRGSRAHAPENTLAAFKLAVAQGAPAIELDAKLTADGEVVVFHDTTLERTTNGHGKLQQQTLAALKELDAGGYFSAAFAGEKIPTLTEVFEAVGHLVFINIELTNYTSPQDELPEKVTALVRHFGLEQRVMFSSFNHNVLQRACKLLPDVPRGLLIRLRFPGTPVKSWIGSAICDYQAIHPAEINSTTRLIKEAHKRGFRVHVYTVNRRQGLFRLFQAGADGIFTDDPPLAFDVLKQIGK